MKFKKIEHKPINANNLRKKKKLKQHKKEEKLEEE